MFLAKVGGQAVLGRQSAYATPWLTERHGYDPTSRAILQMLYNSSSGTISSWAAI